MAKRLRRRLSASTGGEVPGPSTNPATNLLLADIALRTSSYLAWRFIQRGLLKGKYTPEEARRIVGNRPLQKKLAAFAVSKVASRSVPGAMLVGGSLIAKTLFDRSQRRRKSRRSGERELAEDARS